MHRIALLPGDGIGPEVIEQAQRVLQAASDRFAIAFTSETFDLGAERYLRTGETLPQAVFEHLRDDFDAILLGAFGDPRVKGQVHARDILLGLRQRLDLFANIRPVKLIDARFCPLKGRGPADVDMVIVRENTESVYAGIGGTLRKGTPHEIAQTVMISTRLAVERLLRHSFELARTREGFFTLCDKSNAIEDAHGLWRRTLAAIEGEYPDVEARTLYADVAAMRMVTHPHEFDVVVADNVMGDILSDLAAALVGGLGLAPSASIHPGVHALYEPVHGSAPDIVGTGKANPLAAILSVGMMLRDFGHTEAADAVANACSNAVLQGQVTPDLGGRLATADVGAYICRSMAA
jgi:3-isopropylmalate dehydrogenase